MVLTPDSIRQSCEIIGEKGSLHDVRDVIDQVIAELGQLFRDGVLTEPEHDECLDLLFAGKAPPPSDQHPHIPTAENNKCVYPTQQTILNREHGLGS